MSLQNKGLGRGLDALFKPNQSEGEEGGESGAPATLALQLLEPNPKQPRLAFSEDSLRDLAASISQQGILQPILVRPGETPGRYQIIAGERRWRAARLAGLDEAPVIIREVGDQDALVMALIENIQREDLNPIERAGGLRAVKDALGLSQEELADRVGLPRGTISNLLRLLNLPESARDALISGSITMGHARCLASLPDEDTVAELLRKILADDMTVRDAEDAVGVWRESGQFPWAGEMKIKRQPRDPDMARLAKDIGSQLNCGARISGTREKGRISLAYESNEQLFELLEKLGLTLNT